MKTNPLKNKLVLAVVLRLATPLAIVALALGVFTPSVSAADEVTDWNQILVSALTATNTSPQNSGRIAAITHAAVFDAVNGIDRRYTPYFVTTGRAARGFSTGRGRAGGVRRPENSLARTSARPRAAARRVDRDYQVRRVSRWRNSMGGIRRD